MPKQETDYQSSPLELLTNRYWQLQRLAEEGHNVTPAIEEVWSSIADIIHEEHHFTTKELENL